MAYQILSGEPASSVCHGNLLVSSASFRAMERIPPRHTCDGINVNPSLVIDQVPTGTKSLALIVDDPDAPDGTWVHWVIWNIPVIHEIKENSAPGKQGTNDFGKEIYCGPCPPKGTHHYFFKVYALDCKLELATGSKKIALEKAMVGHVLGFGQLIGLYKKSN
jgi:Raf kinase inhibitor-like YbhB/YbcL family protein